MNADAATLEELFTSPNQYVIPIFQRTYAWRKKDWENLWEDIEELWMPETDGDDTQPHFMGSIVLDQQRQQTLQRRRLQVIDGQQRLLTLSILMCALRDVCKRRGFEDLSKTVEELALHIPRARGEDRLRIYPRQQDRDDYVAAVEGTDGMDGVIGEALNFFSSHIDDLEGTGSEEQLENLLYLLLRRLQFVHIILEGENAYQIFSSLNSTGQALSEADLVRNFVFMHVPFDDQHRFDQESWRPIERRFQNADEHVDGAAISGFFRDFLMRLGRYVKPAATFQEFERRYSGASFRPDDLAIELDWSAGYYDVIRGVAEHDSPRVETALAKLRGLQTSTTYPLLLNLLQRVEEGEMDEEDLVDGLEMLSGFILRRYVCGESSRGYSRWFVSVNRELGDRPREELRRFLVDRGYPEDERFERSFVRFNLYGSLYGRYVLEMLERAYGHREATDLTNPQIQIEHIMPQTLEDEWKRDLGREHERIHSDWLHTPGNLTLSAYNPELYNHPFRIKREEYERSNISITRRLASYSSWGEEQIKTRGEELAALAANIWKGPQQQ